MTAGRNVSYELLVAYVDGQLSRAEREYALTLLEQEPELSRRAWDLRQVKDMVTFAYESVVPPALAAPPKRRGLLRSMGGWVAILSLVAAGLLGCALVASGGRGDRIARSPVGPAPVVAAESVSAPGTATGPVRRAAPLVRPADTPA